MNLLCLFGSALGWSLMAAWEHMPARWLCDYGQPPPVRAENAHKSVRIWKKMLCAAGFGCYTALSGRGADAESSVRAIFADAKTVFSFASMLLAVWLLGLVFLADKNYQIIPDQLVVLLVLVGVLRASAAGNAAERLTAGFFCAALFFLLGSAASLPAYRRSGAVCGFGMGDVKLLFAIGVLFGFPDGFSVLAAASLACGFCAAVWMAAGRLSARDAHPFGPYLCAAAAVMFLLCSGTDGLQL